MKRVEHGPTLPPPFPCCSCSQFENIIIQKCLMRKWKKYFPSYTIYFFKLANYKILHMFDYGFAETQKGTKYVSSIWWERILDVLWFLQMQWDKEFQFPTYC
jgi:hypothetical protein